MNPHGCACWNLTNCLRIGGRHKVCGTNVGVLLVDTLSAGRIGEGAAHFPVAYHPRFSIEAAIEDQASAILRAKAKADNSNEAAA